MRVREISLAMLRMIGYFLVVNFEARREKEKRVKEDTASIILQTLLSLFSSFS